MSICELVKAINVGVVVNYASDGLKCLPMGGGIGLGDL